MISHNCLKSNNNAPILNNVPILNIVSIGFGGSNSDVWGHATIEYSGAIPDTVIHPVLLLTGGTFTDVVNYVGDRQLDNVNGYFDLDLEGLWDISNQGWQGPGTPLPLCVSIIGKPEYIGEPEYIAGPAFQWCGTLWESAATISLIAIRPLNSTEPPYAEYDLDVVLFDSWVPGSKITYTLNIVLPERYWNSGVYEIAPLSSGIITLPMDLLTNVFIDLPYEVPGTYIWFDASISIDDPSVAVVVDPMLPNYLSWIPVLNLSAVRPLIGTDQWAEYDLDVYLPPWYGGTVSISFGLIVLGRSTPGGPNTIDVDNSYTKIVTNGINTFPLDLLQTATGNGWSGRPNTIYDFALFLSEVTDPLFSPESWLYFEVFEWV